MENLTPAQTWLLASLPGTHAEVLIETKEAARLGLCVGLPRTDDELRRMTSDLAAAGHCELIGGEWQRTRPKPKKEARLFE